MGQSFSTDSTTKPIPTGINDYLFSEFCRDSTNLDIYNILSNDIQLQVNVYKHYFQYKNGESLSSLGTQIYLSDILPADIKAIFLQISSYLAIYQNVVLLLQNDIVCGFGLFGLRMDAVAEFENLVRIQEDNTLLRILMSKEGKSDSYSLSDNMRLLNFVPSCDVSINMTANDPLVKFIQSYIYMNNGAYPIAMPNWSMSEIDESLLLQQFCSLFGNVKILGHYEEFVSQCLFLDNK